MEIRTILTLALMLTVASACSEGAERREGTENDAPEAAETAGAGEATRAMIELPDALLDRARVTVEAARATALAQLPGARVTAGELEEEDGALIYSFDLRAEGREGIEEVHVDAVTGEVLSLEHEDAADEAREEGGR